MHFYSGEQSSPKSMYYRHRKQPSLCSTLLHKWRLIALVSEQTLQSTLLKPSWITKDTVSLYGNEVDQNHEQRLLPYTLYWAGATPSRLCCHLRSGKAQNSMYKSVPTIEKDCVTQARRQTVSGRNKSMLRKDSWISDDCGIVRTWLQAWHYWEPGRV